MLQDETSHEEKGEDGLCITYYPGPYKSERFRERFRGHLDELVRFPRMGPRCQLGRRKQMDLLVRKTGCRPYSSKALEPARFHTDFLQQLPSSTRLGFLAGVE